MAKPKGIEICLKVFLEYPDWDGHIDELITEAEYVQRFLIRLTDMSWRMSVEEKSIE